MSGPRRVGAALAAVLLAGTVVAAVQPWEFSSERGFHAAERRQGKYTYATYSEALLILDSGRGDPGDAIEKLKVLIHRDPQSKAGRYFDDAGLNADYFPYYQLARAYAKMGRDDEARACLAEEQRRGAVRDSTATAAAVAELRSALAPPVVEAPERPPLATAPPELPDLGANVRRVEGWTEGRSGIVLGTEGRRRVDEVRRAATELERSKAAGNAGAAREAADRVVTGIYDLGEAELARVTARLRALEQGPWSVALRGDPRAVDAGDCRLAPSDRTPQRIGAAQDVLERCSYWLMLAERRAGAWACDELHSAAERLPDAELPRTCDESWASRVRPALDAELDALDYVALRRRLDERIEATQRRAGTAPADSTSALAAARARIPELRPECVADLQIQDAAARLARLNEGAEAATDGEAAVTAALEQLRLAVVEGVAQLVDDREACSDLAERTTLDLQGAFHAWEARPDSSTLSGLCTASAGAVDELLGCWRTDPAPVVERLGDYATLLADARTSWDTLRSVARADPAPACLDPRKVPSARPRRPDRAWAERARADLAAARSCLRDHAADWDEGLLATHSRIRAVEEAAGQAGVALQHTPGLEERVRAIVGESGELSGRLAALDETAGALRREPTAELLGQRLDAAGLRDEVAPRWWDRLRDLRASDPRRAHVAQVALEQAARPALARAAARLPAWERLATALGAYTTLERAFSIMEQGDLDAAIAALRRTSPDSATAGTPRALLHGSLAYFLFLKSSAYPADDAGGVGGTLLRDAVAEVSRALDARPDFVPPEPLFVHAGFREFFESCRKQRAAPRG